ncbi:MAG TPA: glutamine-hydrolyzing carbamoyl-phosphate synthase small subunit [Phycisphaerales bacterium]|nr:glutamine-hydrolyzing carbamoyl-phosphate synthase small subunit [Phycisphaerales bacterium]
MNPDSKVDSKVRLVLEDGSVFHGQGFGATSTAKSVTGEVVFNTAMTGYQEALTDPSYEGQILVMTTTMVGNYGVSDLDVESRRPHVSGFVIRELSRIPSNYRADTDLSTWLAGCGVMGIEGLDTRALVRRLRTAGVMRGVISSDEKLTDDDLVVMARKAAGMAGQNLAAKVSLERDTNSNETLGQWKSLSAATSKAKAKLHRVVALDCGAKRNIYRNLRERGCEVVVMGHDATAEQIRDAQPDGLFISNGPGDPAAVDQTIETLRALAKGDAAGAGVSGGALPTFGICLGHQLLALALGAKTYKLKYGHRGANQPVRNEITGKVEITSQNHGFCVDEESLTGAGCVVTHRHLNDGTVAGFKHASKPIFGVQYHPEASPGPHDAGYLFDEFVEMMDARDDKAARKNGER